jgi:hypothetical protein
MLTDELGVRAIEGPPGEPWLATVQDAARIVEECLSSDVDAALLHAPNLTPKFFDLSSRDAGEILQKLRSHPLGRRRTDGQREVQQPVRRDAGRGAARAVVRRIRDPRRGARVAGGRSCEPMTAATLILALAPMAGGEGTPTIEASFPQPARRPTELLVVFRNPTSQAMSFTGAAHVALKGSDDLSGPFDLERFAPIGPNTRTTLELEPRGARRVLIELRDLLWGRTIQSIWPSSSFREAVLEGTYSVTVEMEGANRSRIASPAVEGTFTVATGAGPSRSPED